MLSGAGELEACRLQLAERQEQLQNFVAPEHLPERLGGTDSWEFNPDEC